jgi:hypothetical protein
MIVFNPMKAKDAARMRAPASRQSGRGLKGLKPTAWASGSVSAANMLRHLVPIERGQVVMQRLRQ